MKFPTSKNAGSEYILIELDDGKILTESPIFDGKKPWFPVDFPLNQSIENHFQMMTLTPAKAPIVHKHVHVPMVQKVQKTVEAARSF